MSLVGEATYEKILRTSPISNFGWYGPSTVGSRTEVGAEGAGPGGRDAESSGIKVGEGDVAEDEGNISGLAVKAGWGACKVVSTLIATLESKVDFF